jgi:hypothetical protein
MTRIVLDSMTKAKFDKVADFAELCDESGHVLGTFIPTYDPARWEPLTPEASDEELAEREKSGEWHSFEQVMDRLSRLENP